MTLLRESRLKYTHLFSFVAMCGHFITNHPELKLRSQLFYSVIIKNVAVGNFPPLAIFMNGGPGKR